MYSLILKMQLKRIWIIYLIVSILFIAGFLFVPYIFMLNVFNLFFFAIMAGIASALSSWTLPKNYLIALPIGITKYRMALQITPLILTILPSLILAICYASGIKGLIMGKLYGNELFSNFKYLQVELLFFGILFQITVLQVTYFLIKSYEYSWVRLANKMKNLGLLAIVNSYSMGFFILALFSFSETSILFPILAVILISSMALPYIDPFKREILQDAHITGGTFRPDKRKLFLYSLIWGIIISCIIILVISAILKLLASSITSTMLPFGIPLVFILCVSLFMDTFTRERGAGNGILKSTASGLCVSIFPPILPFIYSYRLRNATRLKTLMDKYYKKHGPIQSGQVIDYKGIYKSQKKTLVLFIFIGIFFCVFFSSTFIKNDMEKKLTRVESNPSGLTLEFYTDKANETISVKTPAEISNEISSRSAKANGYTLIEEHSFYFPSRLILDFVSNTQFETRLESLKNIKKAGRNRNTIIKDIPHDELFTMIKFFTGTCSYINERNNSISVYKIYFTRSEYEEILDAMLDSYTSKLSEAEASELLLSLKEKNELQGNIFSALLGASSGCALRFYQNIFRRFDDLGKEYKKALNGNPYHLMQFNSVWDNFLFEAFAKCPDRQLTELAFINVSRPSWGLWDANKIYWKYLFQNQKNSPAYNAVIEAAIKNTQSTKSYYHPLRFLASSGSPLALEEIRKRLPILIKKEKNYSFAELYSTIARSYSPETAFDFLVSINYALEIRNRALCFLKTAKVTEFFKERTEKNLEDRKLLDCIGASQNEYLFPVLQSLSKGEKNFTDKITAAVCRFDGILTEKWVDYIRKEGDGKTREFLEKTLEENASCFQIKHGNTN